ncbi:tyrosine-protein phosphatase [Sphingobacterium hungaricum]|uniref:protein-tyrosine-phosphatase n=1 Tax=Sphingobacterium hungaricum TaxID=2082723 RepID=A0A928UZ89_9SPHI|nr:CpsB/CapC family capsule biosynthesis tyrosine phosphatase [Sphingobacterium hungaricum]MBE8714140.1 protein tyrosine phosphatase [Sphingobacterium hungaricum]
MSFWGKLFNSKKSEEKSKDAHCLSWLGCDMHNHLLPAIDDGSQSIEQSIHLIQGLKDLGIHKSVSTPHIMKGVHDNTPATISKAHQSLTATLEERGIDFPIEYSAEYMLDDGLSHLIESDELCLMPKKHMLIEMSYLSESKSLFQTIKDIQDKGYQPILAHPERYNYYHQNFKIYKEIKNAGCMLQLNLLSISRYYGETVKTNAMMMIKAGMYDFVGTDIHHEKHLSGIRRIVNKYDVKDLMKYCTIKNQLLFT